MTITLEQKQTLMENIAVLLQAGIPLPQALETMGEEAEHNEKVLLQVTSESIRKGNSLSTTWTQFPKAFDTISLHLIKAAEESGTLVQCFEYLAQHYKHRKELREKLISALVYPSLIAIICLVVIGVIFFVIIPRIEKVFAELRVEIPWGTQILIDTSRLLRNEPVATIGVMILLLLLVMLVIKTSHHYLLNILSKLPIISQTLRSVDLAYSTRTLGTLLHSGVPIGESMLLTADTVRLPMMKNVYLQAAENVAQGKPFTQTIKEHPHTFPHTYRVMLEAGEQSGSLEKACVHIADRADAQLDTTIKRATTLIEPLLLLIMGLIVAITMLSVLSPIYGLIGGISS